MMDRASGPYQKSSLVVQCFSEALSKLFHLTNLLTIIPIKENSIGDEQPNIMFKGFPAVVVIFLHPYPNIVKWQWEWGPVRTYHDCQDFEGLLTQMIARHRIGNFTLTRDNKDMVLSIVNQETHLLTYTWNQGTNEPLNGPSWTDIENMVKINGVEGIPAQESIILDILSMLLYPIWILQTWKTGIGNDFIWYAQQVWTSQCKK